MEFSINRNTLINKVLAIVIAMVCIAANFYLNNDKLIYLCCVVTCGIILLRSLKHKYLFLLYVFISTYVLFLYPYFINNLDIATYWNFNQASYYQKTIFLFSVFLTSLLFFYKDLPIIPIGNRLAIKDNSVAYYLNVGVIIYILFFAISGETILTASYGSSQVSGSIIYSYFPIFYLGAYLSSGKKKYKLILIHILAVAYGVSNLLYGWRGGIISLGLLTYVLFIDRYISLTGLLILIFLGFLFLAFWGQFRMGISILDIKFSDLLGIGVSYNNKYSVDGNNQTDVFYASVRIITLTDIGLITTYDRIVAFFLFCASVVVPYSFLPPLANLSMYMSGDYGTLGGGMIFSYFYVYLSYFGIILIAYFINSIWNKLRVSNNTNVLAYSLLVFCTVATWFAYGPITMFKMCLLGTIYILGVNTISRIVVGKK